MSPELTSLPNQLTLARIAAIPVIVVLLVIGWDWLRWIALFIYIAAAITDWLDGFLARRMGTNSDLGKMLDPIADKLLVGATLLMLVYDQTIAGVSILAAV
ncbi:MAG: CDP-alcohol phosphatidyltransferase family protein, partial [Devosia sp.]